MIEMTSEGIKSAISNVLLSLAPDVAVYKESRSNPTYPNFFIYQISVTDDEIRKNYHLLSHSMDIYYRTASDPSTDLRLQTNLDSMSLKLLNAFNIIKYGDLYIKCTDKSVRKVDGVLHFTVTLNTVVKNVNLNDDSPKLGSMSLNLGLSKE